MAKDSGILATFRNSSCTLPILFRHPSLQKNGKSMEHRWFLKRRMGEENAESNLRFVDADTTNPSFGTLGGSQNGGL